MCQYKQKVLKISSTTRQKIRRSESLKKLGFVPVDTRWTGFENFSQSPPTIFFLNRIK